MYRILQEEGIDLPRYAVLNRDPDKPDGQSDGSFLIFDTLNDIFLIRKTCKLF